MPVVKMAEGGPELCYASSTPIEYKELKGLRCPLCGQTFLIGDFVVKARDASWTGIWDWMHFECYLEDEDLFPSLKRSLQKREVA